MERPGIRVLGEWPGTWVESSRRRFLAFRSRAADQTRRRLMRSCHACHASSVATHRTTPRINHSRSLADEPKTSRPPTTARNASHTRTSLNTGTRSSYNGLSTAAPASARTCGPRSGLLFPRARSGYEASEAPHTPALGASMGTGPDPGRSQRTAPIPRAGLSRASGRSWTAAARPAPRRARREVLLPDR